ncbi:serine protease [Frigidibacter sp. SD6-1]|uniref:S1 family peptidase n=1 Tax=Frigidibacter sp. SD6-1 TaxID=3032581 RepID=UPI0024DFF28D|nr:serine protease [Frigidibacter sp. SD6-1]
MRAALRAALSALLLIAGGVAVRASDDVTVYIECTADGKTSRGSGVLVSAQGHVLTARHVVPEGASCMGSVGVADANTAARLIVQPSNLPVDMALLRFARQATYPFAPYCPLEDWMVRREIVVAGFPGRTETGAVSYRQGILSTTTPNQAGVLETDGQTVAGMSGGPVFSRNLRGVLGIVAGAEFAIDGTVSYYGIVPLADYAGSMHLTESPLPCYRQSADPGLGAGFDAVWKAGDAPVALNVSPEEGTCFLYETFGEFNSVGDRVWVLPKDGHYELAGADKAGGTHGGRARCVFYP